MESCCKCALQQKRIASNQIESCSIYALKQVILLPLMLEQSMNDLNQRVPHSISRSFPE